MWFLSMSNQKSQALENSKQHFSFAQLFVNWVQLGNWVPEYQFHENFPLKWCEAYKVWLQQLHVFSSCF